MDQRLVYRALIFLGAFAIPAPWLATLRPDPPELRSAREIRISSEEDSGPGSLREAIFLADRSGVRVKLVFDVSRVILQTPLPPLTNPAGIIMDAVQSRCEIDATRLRGLTVLRISAPNSVMQGLGIRGNSGFGILVKANGVMLTGVRVSDCDVGIYLAEGSDLLQVRDSRIQDNRIGIHLPSSSTGVKISNNQFRDHAEAAIWAVAATSGSQSRSPDDLTVQGNRFDQDFYGVVLVNVAAKLEENYFSCARKAAVLLEGPGALVRKNRIQSSLEYGIRAENTQGSFIEENEIDHSCVGGILLRAGNDTVVRDNRLYGNGNGIMVVGGSTLNPNHVTRNLLLSQHQDGLTVVGSSPLITSNQVHDSGGVGLRVLDIVHDKGLETKAKPLLGQNRFSGNRLSAQERGRYSIKQEAAPGPSQSCSWAVCSDKVPG